MRLGLNFCLNKDNKLYYVRSPISDKKKFNANNEKDYMHCLNPSDYMSFMPRFSKDFSRLMFYAAHEKFISHSGYYQLRYFDWPVASQQETQSKLVIDKV